MPLQKCLWGKSNSRIHMHYCALSAKMHKRAYLQKHLTDAVVDTTLKFSTEKWRMKQKRRRIKQIFLWRVLSAGVVLICFGTGPALGSWMIRTEHASTSRPWGKWVLVACRFWFSDGCTYWFICSNCLWNLFVPCEGIRSQSLFFFRQQM